MMNLDEYERGKRTLYVSFAAIVRDILAAAIEREPQLRLVQVQDRAKSVVRLRQKLQDRGILESNQIEIDLVDLAGCRVIFYTNSDVTAFNHTRIIRDNFEVERVKIHHPRREGERADELFIADNYTVRLKPERIALPEYAQFDDLKCEIQVQTILNHAWSEMAHDTIYKRPNLEGFGARQFEGVERRLKKVMREHLLPAGHDFQKILRDFDRLMAGKDLFDQQPLQAIIDAPDNNERQAAIERFATHVLPYYDDVPGEYPMIVEALVKAVERARETPQQEIVTPAGNYPGKSAADVLKEALEIIQQPAYRYIDLKLTVDAAVRLYLGAESDDERSSVVSMMEQLGKHHMRVWERYGPLVQLELLQIVDELPDDDRRAARSMIRAMLAQMLSPAIEGTSWESADTMLLSRGSVVSSEPLSELRAGAITHLEAMLATSASDEETDQLISALFEATDTPFNTNYSNGLALQILNDAARVIGICRHHAENWRWETRQSLEDRALHLHYGHRAVPQWMADDAAIAAANEELLGEIIALRDLLNSDADFVNYKTLVGYNSVFPTAWDEDPFDYEARDAWRERRSEEMVAQIEEANADQWFAFLRRCAETQSNDLATFPPFGAFLVKLATAKPALVLSRIDHLGERLSNFLPGMLRGLIDAGQTDAVVAKLRKWIAEGSHLSDLCWFLQTEARLDLDLLDMAAARARELGDLDAVTHSVSAAARRYEETPNPTLKSIFMDGIRSLSVANDQRWATGHSVLWRRGGMLGALDDDELREFLAALVPIPRMEYPLEEILGVVAERNAADVIAHLSDRMAFERDASRGSNYDATPFTSHSLAKKLAAYPVELVAAGRQWFADDGWLFRFRGGRFLSQAYPTLSTEFADALNPLIRFGAEDDLQFVLLILQNYEGAAAIHDICKEIVEQLPEDSKLLASVENALQATGVVSGEFGFVNAHEARKALVAQWLDDPRERVRRFASDFITHIEQRIAAEQRMAEEDREARLREFRDDTEEDDSEEIDEPD